jgi:RNA polymerase sigma factor (sigma-70 family)
MPAVSGSPGPTGTALPPFQHLLDAHGNAVLRVLTVLVGPSDADDLWQETFLKAWNAYPSLTDATNLRGWLLTIARRCAIDHHRATGRRAVPVDEVPERSAPEAPAPGFDGSVDPQLWAKVDALPPKQRLAVVYRFVGDLAFADIAVLLDCSVDAARRSAHEGVRRLRQEVTR